MSSLHQCGSALCTTQPTAGTLATHCGLHACGGPEHSRIPCAALPTSPALLHVLDGGDVQGHQSARVVAAAHALEVGGGLALGAEGALLYASTPGLLQQERVMGGGAAVGVVLHLSDDLQVIVEAL